MGGNVGFLRPMPDPLGVRAETMIHPEYYLWITFLGLIFLLLLWATRRWGAQKAERRRREVAEENRRKARSLYEEAFGGVALCREGAGEGAPTVLLVHGWCCAHTYSAPQFGPSAERGPRVVAVSLRGNGDSDKPRRRYSMQD